MDSTQREITREYRRSPTIKSVARKTGLTEGQVQSVLQQFQPRVSLKRRRSAEPTVSNSPYSDEDIVEGLYQLTLYLGRIPTTREYEQSRQNGLKLPAMQRLERRSTWLGWVGLLERRLRVEGVKLGAREYPYRMVARALGLEAEERLVFATSAGEAVRLARAKGLKVQSCQRIWFHK